MAMRNLTVGEPCPSFVGNCTLNPKFAFDTTAGRYNVICLFGSAASAHSQAVLREIQQVQATKKLFDLEHFLFSGVTIDSTDQSEKRIVQGDVGLRWFWDFDRNISQLLGSVDPKNQSSQVDYRQQTIVLDERLRVLRVMPFGPDVRNHVTELVSYLESLPRPAPMAMAAPQAPVLIVPRIFEPELCRTLMNYYDKNEQRESGFMKEVEGKTVEAHDYAHKKRKDCEIVDESLRRSCMVRIHDRLGPEIAKAFQFKATRMERYIVACYDAQSGGYFRPHRDNTTKGTAHRRFAVSLVLNTGEFEGGHVRFPEYGNALYSPPAGGAVVFSCSLLHEATPVTAGRRMVFLPFLYDDAAAKIREANIAFVEGATYRAGETKDVPPAR
jgi:predicted 2-oxoglutarate/Fe(II)-dependent dioxygenase YbiX/peroxiredoxin